jgi:tetratricopeptide (TPR) repeat protein
VIEQNPQSIDAFIGRGDAYRDSDNLTQALDDYTQALDLDPDSTTAYFERGYTYQLDNNNEAARDDYQAVLKRDTYYTRAYVQLARLELDVFDDPDAALKYAQQAVDLADSNPYAELVLGDVYYEQGKTANALVHYRRYVELIGSDADVNTLARIHELEGS